VPAPIIVAIAGVRRVGPLPAIVPVDHVIPIIAGIHLAARPGASIPALINLAAIMTRIKANPIPNLPPTLVEAELLGIELEPMSVPPVEVAIVLLVVVYPLLVMAIVERARVHTVGVNPDLPIAVGIIIA